MTTKHLADLLQEEARNLASAQVESLDQVNRQEITTAEEPKEVTLLNQVRDLQTALSLQKASSERSQQELEEAKQMILQLAQSNSQLIEENKGLKQAKDGSKLNNYKKSHLLSEKLTDKPKVSDDFAANTWLYD